MDMDERRIEAAEGLYAADVPDATTNSDRPRSTSNKNGGTVVFCTENNWIRGSKISDIVKRALMQMSRYFLQWSLLRSPIF